MTALALLLEKSVLILLLLLLRPLGFTTYCDHFGYSFCLSPDLDFCDLVPLADGPFSSSSHDTVTIGAFITTRQSTL